MGKSGTSITENQTSQAPLVSIVVLCYNVAAYLDKCLRSISLQTFRDFECIIVDDGSTDSCPDIYRKYIENDVRFRAIRQDNKGLTAARKTGFNAAKGTWCASVDGDDWIGTNMLEKMTGAVLTTGADFAQCRHLMHLKSIAFRPHYPGKRSTGPKGRVRFIKNLTEDDWTEVSLCRSLLQTERLRRIYNRIDDKLIFAEDCAAMALYAADSQKVCILDDELYHYRMRQSASTSTPSQRTLELIYGIHAFLKEEMKKTVYGSTLMPRYSANLVRHCVATMLLTAIPLKQSDRRICLDSAMEDPRFKDLVKAADLWLVKVLPEHYFSWIQAGCIPDQAVEEMKLNREKCDFYE